VAVFQQQLSYWTPPPLPACKCTFPYFKLIEKSLRVWKISTKFLKGRAKTENRKFREVDWQFVDVEVGLVFQYSVSTSQSSIQCGQQGLHNSTDCGVYTIAHMAWVISGSEYINTPYPGPDEIEKIRTNVTMAILQGYIPKFSTLETSLGSYSSSPELVQTPNATNRFMRPSINVSSSHSESVVHFVSANNLVTKPSLGVVAQSLGSPTKTSQPTRALLQQSNESKSETSSTLPYLLPPVSDPVLANTPLQLSSPHPTIQLLPLTSAIFSSDNELPGPSLPSPAQDHPLHKLGTSHTQLKTPVHLAGDSSVSSLTSLSEMSDDVESTSDSGGDKSNPHFRQSVHLQHQNSEAPAQPKVSINKTVKHVAYRQVQVDSSSSPVPNVTRGLSQPRSQAVRRTRGTKR
jgi:hypothetical protein